MAIVCDQCGAPLKPDSTKERLVCDYCGTAQDNAGYRPPRPAPKQTTPTAPAPSGAANMGRVYTGVVVVVILVTVVSVLSGVPAFRAMLATLVDPGPVVNRGRVSPAPEAPLSQTAPISANVSTPLPSGPPDTPSPTAPLLVPPPPLPVVPPGDSVAGEGGKSRKTKTGSTEPTVDVSKVPVVSKDEAKRILEPEILACMKTHDVHYLITRIGQGYDKYKSGTLPLMKVVERSIVDYVPMASFNRSPLGRCVNAAAKKVRASAFKGNYIYFNLRNASAKDPLSGQPEEMDQHKAEAALKGLDAAARACAKTAPSGSKPGESISIRVTFRGIDGSVTKVDPYYVPFKSPYSKCLGKAYGRAVVPKFRKLEAYVVHSLEWQ